MGRMKDAGGFKSNTIVTEVEKRACLYDTSHPHYGDRAEKVRCWEEVCGNVVPGWSLLGVEQKLAAGKEVQKRWRSIRDSYTKAFRQGKCSLPQQCVAGSRRYYYHRQMAFLHSALLHKKPKNSQDKYESLSEVSNSPQHPPSDEFIPKIKTEICDKPLDLKKKPAETWNTCERKHFNTKLNDRRRTSTPKRQTHKPQMVETIQPMVETIRPMVETTRPMVETLQMVETSRSILEVPPPMTEKPKPDSAKIELPLDMMNPSLEIKIDANSILPDDHFDDDKSFMNSLIPLLKKMDDDTRLLCRIEVLKIIRYALQGNKYFEALKVAEDSLFKTRLSGILTKEESVDSSIDKSKTEAKLSMTTRSADGSRPVRKRKMRSPSPLPMPAKKRGPGRPRKIKPQPSDSEEEYASKKKPLKQKSLPLSFEPRLSELDEILSKATSVAQLETPLFMKMYNLERSKNAPELRFSHPTSTSNALEVTIKAEPKDPDAPTS